MRVEREATRRNNASVVITTLLSLLVVVAAVAIVAYLVLRTPSTAVDSAERLDPVGTALPAPTDQPVLPTVMPTEENQPEPEPTALGFTGEQPAVAGLPTVAAPEEASGPTPTPRVIAQPTEPPPTPLPAAPTLPPSVPVTQVPVVALQPVEAAPPPAPTSAPAQTQQVSQPTPSPNEVDDDPFDIFDDENDSRIVPVAEDPLERVREMQEEMQNDRPGVNPTLAPGEERRRDDSDDAPEIEIPDIAVPTPANSAVEPRTVTGRDGSIEVVVPDVDAMIDEITARTTDPNRNPNTGDAARRALDDDDDDDDRQNDRQSSNDKKRKSLRDRIKERTGRSNSSSADDDDEGLVPNFPSTNNNPVIRDSDGDCGINDPNFPFC
jgi:hypothetical protein